MRLDWVDAKAGEGQGRLVLNDLPQLAFLTPPIGSLCDIHGFRLVEVVNRVESTAIVAMGRWKWETKERKRFSPLSVM